MGVRERGSGWDWQCESSSAPFESGLLAGDLLLGADKPNDNSEYHLMSRGMATYGHDDKLRWASGRVTRQIATRLPEAIARYISECAAEATANDATTVKVEAAK